MLLNLLDYSVLMSVCDIFQGNTGNQLRHQVVRSIAVFTGFKDAWDRDFSRFSDEFQCGSFILEFHCIVEWDVHLATEIALIFARFKASFQEAIIVTVIVPPMCRPSCHGESVSKLR